MKQATFLKINQADNVVVCLEAKKKGDLIDVDGRQITVNQDTPAGHKILIKDVKKGINIIKYGYPIGNAMEDLKAGDWVNENNLKTNLSGTLEYTYNPVNEPLKFYNESRSFKGYIRKNGDVGIRNEIWIVPTVGCVNGIGERLAAQLRKETGITYTAGITTMAALSSPRITRTPARCFATSVCTPMQEPFLCSVLVARTISPRTSCKCLATTIRIASNSLSPNVLTTRWRLV